MAGEKKGRRTLGASLFPRVFLFILLTWLVHLPLQYVCQFVTLEADHYLSLYVFFFLFPIFDPNGAHLLSRCLSIWSTLSALSALFTSVVVWQIAL